MKYSLHSQPTVQGTQQDFIRMRVKYTAKWGLQIAEMIFQTRSRTYCYTYLSILHPNEQLYLSIPSFLMAIQ